VHGIINEKVSKDRAKPGKKVHAFDERLLASIGCKTKLLRLMQRVDVTTRITYLSPEVL